MSSTPLHLDWRTAPGNDEILDRIHDLLDEIDENARAKIVLSGSLTGVNGAELHHVDSDGNIIEDGNNQESTRMFVFNKKTTNKRAVDYFLKLAVVTQRIVQDIDKGVPVPQRLFGYYWTHKSLKRAAAFSLATDLALTIGVHPYNLGLVPEVDGRFSLPRTWSIRFHSCENILDRDPSGSIKTTIRTIGGPIADASVPSLIQSLEVRRSPNGLGAIKAVIVFEHKNIKFMFSSLVKKNDFRFKDIIYISTGGFPDRGTREFLKLLMADKMLKDVPCIYISDRDPHAMEIFSVLKYGSRENAFESRITATNKIQWGGISIIRFKKMADQWPETALQDYIQRNPQSSENDRAKELERLQKATEKALIKPLKQASALLNAADKNRLKHFFKHKNFSQQYDTDLYTDLIAMGMNELGSQTAINPNAKGEKFGLARLNQLDVFGIERCVADIMMDFSVADVQNTMMRHSIGSANTEVWENARSRLNAEVLQAPQSQVSAVRSSSGTVEASNTSSTLEELNAQSSTEAGSPELSQEQLQRWSLMFGTSSTSQ